MENLGRGLISRGKTTCSNKKCTKGENLFTWELTLKVKCCEE